MNDSRSTPDIAARTLALGAEHRRRRCRSRPGPLLPRYRARRQRRPIPCPTYQPWTGTSQGKASQKMLTDLKAKIAQAEKDQAASPDFIADLKKVIADFEAATTVSQAQPFLDTFSDGEYADQPRLESDGRRLAGRQIRQQ